MNIQPGNSNRRKSVKHDTGDSAGYAEAWKFAVLVAQTALVIMVFGAFFYAYITLDNRIARSAAEVRIAGEEIEKVEREISSLQGWKSHYSSMEYITAQIRRFNLPLRTVNHRQVRRLTVLSAEQASRVPLMRQQRTTARNGFNRWN